MDTETAVSPTAYERDFALWVATQIGHLRAGDLARLDVEHIVEELEGLTNRDRVRLTSRLRTAFEHLLKLSLYPDSDARRGWDITVSRSVDAIADLLQYSPSLRNLLNEATYRKAFRRAMREFSTVSDREAAYADCVAELERRLHAEAKEG